MVSRDDNLACHRPLAVVWRKSAPHNLRTSGGQARDPEAWNVWRRHLAERKTPVELDRLHCELFETPSIEDSAVEEAVAERIEYPCDSWTLDFAMAELQWCRRLPKLAATLPAETWWKLWERVVRTAVDAVALPVGENGRSDNPTVQQLLAGELPLLLGYLFPEIRTCRKLLREARRSLSAGVADLLDGRGLLHARHFKHLRSLLTCWTRCRVLGERLKRNCWPQAAERQYRRFVRNSLRLSRPDGSPAFGDSTDGAAVLAVAVQFVGDKVDRGIAGRTLDCASKLSAGSRKRLAKPAVHSEWAETAVMRCDWSRSSPRLTTLYSDSTCRTELACGRDVLWSGRWALDVRIDGVEALPTSEWSELCWVSDDDVDYLELQIDLAAGVRVQRHMVLAREDGFLLMADSVLAPQRVTIEYRGTLPLVAGATLREACETREVALVAGKRSVRTFPLALPEQLAVSTDSRLQRTDAGLELCQAGEGHALFAPVFFDLNPKRANKPALWRQLTVGDVWKVMPSDMAVGYRVAIGRQQWLIYRSLCRPSNRSVLGHNLISEMLVARFGRDGEVESLIEIE